MTHDYKRNGTTSLYAALEIASGEVTGGCYPRHTHEEFLAFLDRLVHANLASGLRDRLPHEQSRPRFPF